MVVALLASALISIGCLKKTYELQNKRAVRKNYQEYGELAGYGARCDHVEKDIAYAPGEPGSEFLTLDVLWNEHEGIQPIIVQIHGGAWEVGDKTALNSRFRSLFLANHGYVVVNVNYRMLPHHPIKTQVEDVMGAVIWAKEHAADYGADPDRVGVVGGSAGGHLTAMVAWASDDEFFSPTGHEDSDYDSDVLAAVPFYGVFDLEDTLASYPYRKKESGLKSISYRYFTGAKKGPARDELFRHISPKRHLDASVPPTYFVCGDEDNFYLYPQSVEYENRLRELGVPTGLYTAEGAKHGFDVHYGEDYSIEAMEKTLEWFDRYLKKG